MLVRILLAIAVAYAAIGKFNSTNRLRVEQRAYEFGERYKDHIMFGN